MSGATLLERIGRNTLAQLLSLGVTFADRLIGAGLLVRAWGPERFGEWALLFSGACLILLGEAGCGTVLGNLWQRARGDAVARVCGLAAIVAMIQAVVLAGLAGLWLAFSGLRGEDGAAFSILALALVLLAARGGVGQFLRAKGEFAAGALLEALPTLATVAGTAGVALAGGSIVALAGVYLLAQLVFGWGATLLLLMRRFADFTLRPVRPSRDEIGQFARQLRWVTLGQNAPLAWTQAPILLLGAFGISGAALAGFLLVRTLVGLARQLASVLAVAAGVELAREDLAHGRIGAVTRVLCALSAALGAGVIVWGPALLGLWTGEAELFDQAVAAWLVAGSLTACLGAPLAQTLLYSGAPRAPALALVGQLGAGLVGAGLLLPGFGIAGAAAGLAMGEVVGLIILLRMTSTPLISLLPALIALGTSLGWNLLVAETASAVLGDWPGIAAWAVFGLSASLVLALPPSVRRRVLTRRARMRSAAGSA